MFQHSGERSPINQGLSQKNHSDIHTPVFFKKNTNDLSYFYQHYIGHKFIFIHISLLPYIKYKFKFIQQKQKNTYLSRRKHIYLHAIPKNFTKASFHCPLLGPAYRTYQKCKLSDRYHTSLVLGIISKVFSLRWQHWSCSAQAQTRTGYLRRGRRSYRIGHRRLEVMDVKFLLYRIYVIAPCLNNLPWWYTFICVGNLLPFFLLYCLK